VDDSSRFILTEETKNHLAGEPWIEGMNFSSGMPDCVKAFAGPLREGRAAVMNRSGRERLEIEWDTKPNNTLGLWLTRGGWNGYHHVALEPANGAPDSLAESASAGRCGLIQPGETQSWHVHLRVGA
jgi:galactose mutarotase-like enzyme